MTSVVDGQNDNNDDDDNALIMFALPHHMDKLVEERTTTNILKKYSSFCRQSLFGPACIVIGNTWKMVDDLPRVHLYAPRSPKPKFLSQLIESLQTDIHYKIQEKYTYGIGDTYLSGKQLAKLGRILLIANEVNYLCSNNNGGNDDDNNNNYYVSSAYETVCEENKNRLPTKEATIAALTRLRNNVEIWINGKAKSPFVYDTSWGGIINCGCDYDGKEGCTNKVDDYDCPAFTNHDINFGNGTF